jgi:hypothetical protein
VRFGTADFGVARYGDFDGTESRADFGSAEFADFGSEGPLSEDASRLLR